MPTTQPWDKWLYNSPSPISSNNGMINPAPNTSQQNFASPPKAPTTYIPKTPSIPNAVPSAVTNSQGLTAQQMGALAEKQMQDRVINASKAAPNTLQIGAQTGVLRDGTPQRFQAYTYGQGGQQTGLSQSGAVPALTPPGAPVGGAGATTNQPKYVFDATQGGYVQYKEPDTTTIDKQLSDYYDPNRKISEIDANLKAAREGINADWNNQVRDAMRNFDNRKQEQFSNLAGVGTGINPLSSAGMSTANANELLYNRFKASLDNERNVKLAAAEAAARGERTDAFDKQAEYLKTQRTEMLDKAENDYKRSVNAQEDMLNRIMKTRQIAQMDRAMTEDEKDNAKNVITDYFKMSGSNAFSDMSSTDIRAMETKAGLPAGYIKSTLEQLKAEEVATAREAYKPQFKQAGNAIMQYVYNPDTNSYDMVSKDVADNLRELGGSLYNITYDPVTGQPKATSIVNKPVSGGSRGGGGGGGGIGGNTTTYSSDIENRAMESYYKNTLSLPPSNKTQRQDIVDMFVAANPNIGNMSIAEPKNPFSYKQAPSAGGGWFETPNAGQNLPMDTLPVAKNTSGWDWGIK